MDYPKLKIEASERLKQLSIYDLGLQARTVELITARKPKDIALIKDREVATLSDLLSVTRKQLKDYIQSDRVNCDNFAEILKDVEETLAGFGLKFKDSDFIVGEVSLSRLDILPKLKNKIDSILGKDATLDGLANFGARRLKNTGLTEYEITQLSIALERYGLSIDGAKYTLNPRNFFPEPEPKIVVTPPRKYKRRKLVNTTIDSLSLDEKKLLSVEMLPVISKNVQKFKKVGVNTIGDYLEKRKNLEPIFDYRTLNNVDDYLRELGFQVTLPEVTLLDSSSKLSREEVLKLDIESLHLSSKYLYGLYNENIRTIGDLIKRESNGKSKLGRQTYRRIVKLLSKHDIRFENADDKIIDGEIIKINPNLRCLLRSAPEQVDFNSLSEEEKQKFLNTNIEDFGFTSIVASELSNYFKTFGDIVNSSPDFIRKKLNLSTVRALKRTLNYYNIDLGKRINGSRENYHQPIHKLIENVEIGYSDLSEEEKQEFLQLPLNEVGFNENLSRTLRETYGIECLDDLVKTDRKKLLHGLASSSYTTVRKILGYYGLNFENNEENSKPYVPQGPVISVSVVKRPNMAKLQERIALNERYIMQHSTVDELYDNLCHYGMDALYNIDAKEFKNSQSLEVIQNALNNYFSNRMDSVSGIDNEEILRQNYNLIKNEKIKASNFLKSVTGQMENVQPNYEINKDGGEEEPER